MKEGTVVGLRQPGSFSDDPLTDILRSGARQLLAQAIEAEVGAHIAAHSDLTDGSGRRRVVRHGHSPEREIQTGIGAVRVRSPRARDRDPHAPGGAASKPSRWPPSNGSTSSTIAACSSLLETFRPPKQKRSTMRKSMSPLWWRDSNQTASGNPGAVQNSLSLMP